MQDTFIIKTEIDEVFLLRKDGNDLKLIGNCDEADVRGVSDFGHDAIPTDIKNSCRRISDPQEVKGHGIVYLRGSWGTRTTGLTRKVKSIVPITQELNLGTLR